MHSKLPSNICIFLCKLVCKYSESVHSKIPELGIGRQRSQRLFLYFGFHTTNAPEEAERAESFTSHSSHGPKQNTRAYVLLDISRMVVTTMNSTHKPKGTELEIKNNGPIFKLWLFSPHPVFATVRSRQHDQAQTAHKKGRHSAAEYAALQL